jgi:hypothetical protein
LISNFTILHPEHQKQSLDKLFAWCSWKIKKKNNYYCTKK